MQDHFKNFFNKWNGQVCEVSDPNNYAQCFDLAFAFCDELGVPRTAIQHLYASQIWTLPTDLTIKYFEMIPNTAFGVPQCGDIVVFKTGTAGHVSIANGVGDVNNFQSFDQNWGSTVRKCGLITHVYDDVLGFLRFREPISPPLVINDQTKISKDLLNWKEDLEVQQIRGLLGDLVKCQEELEAIHNAPVTQPEPIPSPSSPIVDTPTAPSNLSRFITWFLSKFS